MHKIGRFEILGELGRGSVSQVFKGRDPALGQLAAIKVPQEVAGDDGGRARLLDEANVLRLLSHSAIPTVYEVGEDGGLPYLAMEFLEGEDLASLLRRRVELPIERASATMPAMPATSTAWVAWPKLACAPIMPATRPKLAVRPSLKP